MVHFVFLGGEEALETSANGFAVGVGDLFGEYFGGDGLHPGSKPVAFGAQEIDNFGFCARLGLFGEEAIAEAKKIKADEGGQARGLVQFFKDA